jgi:uncharacterized membrane protein
MRAAKIASVAFGVALVAYPVAAYVSFSYLQPRVAAAVLLVAFVPAALARLRSPARRVLAPLALLPVLAALMLVGSVVLASTDLALLVPVALNAALLVAFGSTLRFGPPMIERFARLQVEDLGPAELRWCRGWTWGWMAFFAVNGLLAAVVTWRGSMAAWTAYNGLWAYVLMGHLLGIEYTVRKYRFGRLGDHALDRALARMFGAIRSRD